MAQINVQQWQVTKSKGYTTDKKKPTATRGLSYDFRLSKQQ